MVFPPSLPEWLKRLHPVAALYPRCLSSFPACKRIRGPFLGHSPVMCFLFIPLGLPHRVKAASSTFTCLHCRATAASPLGPTGLRKSRRNPNQPRPEGGEGVLATRPGGRSALQAITWVTVSSANCGSLGATRQRERGKQASPVRLRRQQMAGEPEPRTGAGPAAVSARGPGRGAPGHRLRPPPPPQPTPIPVPSLVPPPQGRGPRRLLPGGWVRRCQRAASFITSARAQGSDGPRSTAPSFAWLPGSRTTSARGTETPGPCARLGREEGTVTWDPASLGAGSGRGAGRGSGGSAPRGLAAPSPLPPHRLGQGKWPPCPQARATWALAHPARRCARR